MTDNDDVRAETMQPASASMPASGSDQAAMPVPTHGHQPVGPGALPPGPLGQVRSTGACIALSIVTLGIYGLVWFFKSHEEMKRHSNSGLGGGLALVLSFFLAFVMWFLTPSEIGGLYERRGMRAPVSGATGLWPLLLGWFFGLGFIIWFVKVNGALNSYWRAQGVR